MTTKLFTPALAPQNLRLGEMAADRLAGGGAEDEGVGSCQAVKMERADDLALAAALACWRAFPRPPLYGTNPIL